MSGSHYQHVAYNHRRGVNHQLKFTLVHDLTRRRIRLGNNSAALTAPLQRQAQLAVDRFALVRHLGNSVCRSDSVELRNLLYDGVMATHGHTYRLSHIDSEVHDDVLRTYNSMAAAYIAQAPARVEGPMQVWLDAAVRGLSPRNTKILEVGAGSGRDALYFKARGYEIECSDSSLPFVKHLTELGLPARKIDLLVDQIGVEYDLVFANSVVCHFTKSQFSWALSSINSALVPEGRFAFTTKHSPRYEFRYAERAGMRRPFSSWPVDRLTEFLSVHGFAVDFQAVSKSLETKSDWINIVATKMGSSV